MKTCRTKYLVLAAWFAIAAPLMAVAGCVYQGAAISGTAAEKMKEHRFEKLYSVKVPESMSLTHELNEQAGTQFMNKNRKMYMLVIHESKEEFISVFRRANMYDESKSVLENYAEFQRNVFEDVIAKPRLNTPITYAKRNKLNVADAVLEGHVEEANLNIHYRFCYIEGKQHMYFMMCWTLLDLVSENADELKAIAHSFREI